MSKGIKKLTNSRSVKYDMKPYNNYLKYLKSYDTSNVDTTLSNLTDYARNESSNLSDMGDYNFSADGSDWARKRTEDATYQSYIDKLTPQFDRQRESYATMLQNQGIPVGSEAYERAMGDLQEKQDEALNQAAYQSVLNGQNAFTQSLNNELSSKSFSNQAQQAYINQLLSALQGSASGYENQQNIFSVGSGKSNLKYQQDKANAHGSILDMLMQSMDKAGQGAAQGYQMGGPWGAVIGGAMGGSVGAYQGYQQNPYG